MLSKYFEDFHVGQSFQHRRGRTFTQEENVRWTLLTMNTAQAHWNHEHLKHYMDGQFEQPLVNAALVVAATVGLTSQDISENSLGDESISNVRISTPVVAGDTIWAASEILDLKPHASRADFGCVVYQVTSLNQRDVTVCELNRTVSVKRKSEWFDRDQSYTDTRWATLSVS